ncbi:CHAT domain-containing protein [Lacinutrix neustonica]|uniref:CHAT domain-containing protein n=1 Tax=Lacinutrix neustonica TaxID=2980107 RepID=A0A9E8SED9_9FLAO|nr:CHAT domain-containing protein [Lacinutrix neustonica]WAC03453.1 CHAT domain-containing protein [Lacinutrix neustonica]
MKKTQLFLILTFGFYFSSAQKSNLKSLEFLEQKAGEFAWTNKDSAYHYFNKVKILARAEKDWKALAENYINTIRSAAYHSRKELDLETISKNLDELNMLFVHQNTFFSTHPDYLFYKNCLLNDRATYYFQLDDYGLAQDTFDALIENILTNGLETITPGNIDLLSSAYIYKAKMYSDEGKYELSKVYFERNLRLLEDLKPNDKKYLFANYSLLGELYKRQANYEKSNTYFIPSLKYKLRTNGKKNGIVTDAQNIFSNHIKLEQIDSATFYLKLIKAHLKDGDTYEPRYHHAKAELFKAAGNYEDALTEQQVVLNLYREKWTTKKHLEVAQSHRSIALTLSELNKPEKALQAYNLAIDELTDSKTINSTVNKTELLKLYNDKTDVLLKLKNNSEAFATANRAITLLDSLKPSFKTETDKLFIVDQAYPIFENGLKAAYNLYIKTKDFNFINQAFFISEKSKSTLLLEALLSAKVTTFKTVPHSLLTKEKQLKTKINFIEKKIDKSKTDLNVLMDDLFNVKKEYNDIVETIENNYKSYYDLKYNSKVASIETMQLFLGKDDVLLSYFYGKESLFVISITKTEKHFTQVQLNETIENLVKEVYILLSNPKSDLGILHDKSFELYSLILESHLQYSNKKNLIVLPDGLLNYIPFSALTTNESNYNYLLEDYAISYANSATLLLQLQERKQNNNNVLAFAPTFKNSSLLTLPNNKKEAQQVLSHFSGDLYSGIGASLGKV